MIHAVLQFALLVTAAAPEPAAPDPAALDHFERKVRPLLVDRCNECHTGDKIKGGLRLDSSAAILKGGDSGPALLPGKPDESLLMQAVRQTHAEIKMPPRNKLSDAQIADLALWIKGGAPFPAADIVPAKNPGAATDFTKARRHWAFLPITKPEPPAVKDAAWPAADIDRFILAKLEAASLAPAPPADKRTLIRRATFDLTGLPPTPQEIAAFLADHSPQSFASVIDRLLASPRYGERWGRYWLDIARYADSNGSDENKAYANAFRYRDYVIVAFNSDRPYDQFITQQIAGDLLPPTSDAAEQYDRWTATGFLVLGPKMLAEQDKPKLVMDIIDEQIDVLSQSLMGLTIGCARCHDHKFDPISAQDYYALAGVFKSTKTMANLDHVSLWMQRKLASPPEIDAAAAHAKAVGELEKRIAGAEKELKAASGAKGEPKAQGAAEKKGGPEGKGASSVVAAPSAVREGTRTADGAAAKVEAKASAAEALKAMREELAKLKAAAPAPIAEAMSVAEGKAAEVAVHIRGSHLNLGAKTVPRAEPAVLSHLAKMPAIPANQSGRLQLAQWLTDPKNPLTSRVMVNRIWQGHFGFGLVRSPSNFGIRGEAPTHPQLLDHLAATFIEQRWSIKSMHRAIMLSKAYQMSARHDERAAALDPDNRLLWRMNRRRLEAEAIRDSIFAVGGGLDLTMGGSLLATKNDDYVAVNLRNGGGDIFKSPRRAVYLPVVRNALYPLFSIFDYGEAGVPIAQRTSTTVSHQALFMLNSALVMEHAAALAKATLAMPDDDAAKLRHVYETLFARSPSEGETQRAARFLIDASKLAKGEKKDDAAARAIAWERLCHALMATSEFIYVD